MFITFPLPFEGTERGPHGVLLHLVTIIHVHSYHVQVAFFLCISFKYNRLLFVKRLGEKVDRSNTYILL